VRDFSRYTFSPLGFSPSRGEPCAERSPVEKTLRGGALLIEVLGGQKGTIEGA